MSCQPNWGQDSIPLLRHIYELGIIIINEHFGRSHVVLKYSKSTPSPHCLPPHPAKTTEASWVVASRNRWAGGVDPTEKRPVVTGDLKNERKDALLQRP